MYFFPANESIQASCDRKCTCFLIKQRKLTVLTMPMVNSYYDSITCLPEGKNADNNERSYGATDFRWRCHLGWFSTHHRHEDQRSHYTEEALSRAPWCLHGQSVACTCALLMTGLAKHLFLPLPLLKSPSFDKNICCHPNYG